MVLPRLPMTKALRTLFETEFEPAGMPVGLGSVPLMPNPEPAAPADEQFVPVKVPYWILHPLWTTTFGPPMSDPNADADWNYQASAYSAKGSQIEWMLDKARELVVGKNPDRTWAHPLAVDGMHVMDRTLAEDLGADPTTGTNGILRFVIKVTPDY